jgi:hypothetical protein
MHHRQLGASLGAPEPHDFAVRGSACSSGTASASIAARNSAYRDDAYAPLHEAGCIKGRQHLARRESDIFFASRLDEWNRVEAAREIRFLAQQWPRAFSRRHAARSMQNRTDLPDRQISPLPRVTLAVRHSGARVARTRNPLGRGTSVEMDFGPALRASRNDGGGRLCGSLGRHCER